MEIPIQQIARLEAANHLLISTENDRLMPESLLEGFRSSELCRSTNQMSVVGKYSEIRNRAQRSRLLKTCALGRQQTGNFVATYHSMKGQRGTREIKIAF